MQPVALLARVAQGDREAFGRFYDAFAGLALGTVKTRARLGLERLRRLIAGEGPAEPWNRKDEPWNRKGEP
jgi:hypothetical protein